jgi:transcriptional regulator with XRE-family HTH domain
MQKKTDPRREAILDAIARSTREKSETEVAEKIGVSRNAWYQYRKNPANIRLGQLWILAKDFTDTEILSILRGA